MLFLLLAGLLLASFPARNGDVWLHLAEGRYLVQGHLPAAPGWLYDLVCYGLYTAFGGAALVCAKALVVAGLAFVLWRLARTRAGLGNAMFCTALALLAMSTRLLLQPATVSYLFLGLVLRQVWGQEEDNPRRRVGLVWLAGLFVLWVNLDGGFVLGLATVALIAIGRLLDSQGRGAGRQFGVLAVLAALCLLNPITFHAFRWPAELGWQLFSTGREAARSITSPLKLDYVTTFGRTPAGMAYYPLLALGVASFVLNQRGWQWQRFLPWLGLAALSAVQARAIPFFAVVGGPVLAWNLADWARVEQQESVKRRGRLSLTPGFRTVLGTLLALAFLASAWPGFLQGPPYEPRRWAVETGPGLQRGAEAVARWHDENFLEPNSRGLHLSPDAAAAFAWYCPQDAGLVDPNLSAGVLGEPDAPADWADQLRAAHVDHVIVYDNNATRLMGALDRLQADAKQWPLLLEDGGVAIFGWRDPARPERAKAFAGAEVDLNRLGFHPPENKRAPRESSAEEPKPTRWWETFWKRAPGRNADRDEAALYLVQAEALRSSALARSLETWQRLQAAGLVGAAARWSGPAGMFDAGIHGVLLQPQVQTLVAGTDPPSPLEAIPAIYQKKFTPAQNETPPGVLYLAVRAARRAIAANRNDAEAWEFLGESYVRLLRDTTERFAGERVKQLRQVQACEALNQAVKLNPELTMAHRYLADLYREMKYVDLALLHLRAYHKLRHAAGRPRGLTPQQFRDQEAGDEEEIKRLAEVVEDRENTYATESVRKTVADKAELALGKGLGGKAADLLLASDYVDFGARGAALELEVLLRTGQASKVRDWTSPEQKAALKPLNYHWTRTLALAALGDYGKAEEELTDLAADESSPGPLTEQHVMALIAGQMLLDAKPHAGPCGYLLFWRPSLPPGAPPLEARLFILYKTLRTKADARVFRGLLALEEGRLEQAEEDFRLALSVWQSEEAVASGAGIPFNMRPLAQTYLGWMR